MNLSDFNKLFRPRLFSELRTGTFDLLIIGGGITGASIFRDASLRGLRAALVEARDFASGTSSRSSKLVHGGLRYLKTGNFDVTWESCHERDLHVRLNKRLVRPVPFLIPIYLMRGMSRRTLGYAMWGYELMSGLRNHRWHRFLSREETLLRAPGLDGDGLTGGCLYYDAIVNDNRWTLETVKDGLRRGGVAINYAPAIRLTKENGHCTGAVVRDAFAGREHAIRAAVVVNAAGVFADTIRRLDRPDAAPVIALSKGTHLVFDAKDIPLDITVAFSSPVDNRLMFIIREEECFLFGTTDDWQECGPQRPRPGARDVAYLLESLNRFMPSVRADARMVRYAYAGFRPLICKDKTSATPDTTSRADYTEISPSGLISIMGGKLTTARRMAEKTVDRIMRLLRRNVRRSSTHMLSLGGTNEEIAEGISQWSRVCPALKDYVRVLFNRYGTDAHDICRKVIDIFEGRHPDPRAEPIRAEVEYSCAHEMVCTVEDLLERRAGFLSWSCEKRLERARYGAHIIGPLLGATQAEFEEQIGQYQRILREDHSAEAEQH